MSKLAFVDAHMPELRGPKAFQSGHGEASTAKAAISRAMGDMLRKVKGKRISIIKAQITLTTKAEGLVEVPKESDEKPADH